jgi:hypothetical protein
MLILKYVMHAIDDNEFNFPDNICCLLHMKGKRLINKAGLHTLTIANAK